MITVSKEIISKAKTSNNILEVMQECGIKLIKENNHFKAICPFHDDKEPSLKVDPQKQVYNCFGCGNGGDIIKFLIDYKKIEFKDAVNFLLRRAGLEELKIENEELRIKKTTNENTQTKPATIQAESETSEPTNQNAQPIQTASEQPQAEIEKQNPEPNETPQTANENFEQKKSENPEPEKKEMTEAERITLLNRVAEFYHKKFLENKRAPNYLFLTRKIKDKTLANAYKIGFCDGSLMKTIETQPEYKTQLVTLGVIKQNEKTGQYFEAFKNCVVFPIFDEENNCVNIYGRKIIDGEIKHLYLSGLNRGVFNWQTLKQNKTVIITESIIDCLSLIDCGITNAIPLYGIDGLLSDHLALLKKYKTKNIFLMLDNDKAGNEAAEKLTKILPLELSNIKIKTIQIPEYKDINEAYINAGEIFLIDLIEKNVKTEPQKKEKYKIEMITSENFITIKIDEILYKIQCFNNNDNKRSTQLRVNIRASFNAKFYIDTFDLYSGRARDYFKKNCAETFGIEPEIINENLNIIIEKLENHDETEIETKKEPDYKMTDEEKKDALELLKNKKLIKTILRDFETIGYIGEDTNKLVGYLAAISRKLDEPLAIIIMSLSAAGKSFLLDSILKLVPPEDYLKYTAVTGQALFYKGENSLVNKLLAIVESEGAERASYSLKTIQSDQELNIAATGKDPKSGKLKTYDYKVKGPISIFVTTTEAEIDYETLNRFIVLTVDESKLQTQKILEQQRRNETIEGMMAKLETLKIARKYQNAQRLLKPLRVLIPKKTADRLKFLDDRLRTRRDHKKYLMLIKTIAFLHQYQRPINKLDYNGQIVEYIEVTPDDIESANDLAMRVLIRTLDELAPQSRTLLKLIRELTDKKLAEKLKEFKDEAKKDKTKKIPKPEEIQIKFTRKEIRDWTKWGDFQVRTHLDQLINLEYLYVIAGRNGKQFLYELNTQGVNFENSPCEFLTSKKELLEAETEQEKAENA